MNLTHKRKRGSMSHRPKSRDKEEARSETHKNDTNGTHTQKEREIRRVTIAERKRHSTRHRKSKREGRKRRRRREEIPKLETSHSLLELLQSVRAIATSKLGRRTRFRSHSFWCRVLTTSTANMPNHVGELFQLKTAVSLKEMTKRLKTGG